MESENIDDSVSSSSHQSFYLKYPEHIEATKKSSSPIETKAVRIVSKSAEPPKIPEIKSSMKNITKYGTLKSNKDT